MGIVDEKWALLNIVATCPRCQSLQIRAVARAKVAVLLNPNVFLSPGKRKKEKLLIYLKPFGFSTLKLKNLAVLPGW